MTHIGGSSLTHACIKITGLEWTSVKSSFLNHRDLQQAYPTWEEDMERRKSSRTEVEP